MTIPHPIHSTHFCTQCGNAVEQLIPTDDTRIRAVCPNCSHIHYDNPNCVVHTIPVYQSKVLLCLRAIEPRLGYWTLPGGFLECGETMIEGACRETREEACALVQVVEPVYVMVDIPHISQIHIFFRANLMEQTNVPLFAAGQETLEARLFALEDIPWERIAFNSVRFALQNYVTDTQKNHFATLHHTLTPVP